MELVVIHISLFQGTRRDEPELTSRHGYVAMGYPPFSRRFTEFGAIAPFLDSHKSRVSKLDETFHIFWALSQLVVA